jgi:hypothetical protein
MAVGCAAERGAAAERICLYSEATRGNMRR